MNKSVGWPVVAIFLPNVAMSRDYGWRGGCSAADVPDGGDGSVEWFGKV
jgi:hypothetical protein